MTEYRFIEPLDVLHLRGNRLFGEAGSHANALMPPWPSLVAGALRSRMLVDADIEFADFVEGQRPTGMSEALHACLGSPTNPGTFRVNTFTLGRRIDGTIEPYFPLPADVVVNKVENSEAKETLHASYLHPTGLDEELLSSFPLTMLPVLAAAAPAKPEANLWLNRAGLEAYLAGQTITAAHLIKGADLWKLDQRLGIALDQRSRTAADGQLYTAEAVALHDSVGFLVGVDGAEGLLPTEGLLRFGGDGRGAALSVATPHWPTPDWKTIKCKKRCRLVLTTPGIFAQGWRLPGLGENGFWQISEKLKGTLVSASVSRSEVVGGVNMAAASDTARAKTARRAAPPGAVYWLQELKGEIQDGLELLQTHGWGKEQAPDPQRWAEGFNNVMVAAWPEDSDGQKKEQQKEVSRHV